MCLHNVMGQALDPVYWDMKPENLLLARQFVNVVRFLMGVTN
jgi:hypothetical protein